MADVCPPRWAVRLVDAAVPRNPALAGDLTEELHRGRSRAWYRRQAILTALVASAAAIQAQKFRSTQALAVSLLVFCLMNVVEPEFANFANLVLQPHVPRWFLDYNLHNSWGAVIAFVAGWYEGWVVVGLNRDHELPALFIYVTAMLVSAVWYTLMAVLATHQAHQSMFYILVGLPVTAAHFTGIWRGGFRSMDGSRLGR